MPKKKNYYMPNTARHIVVKFSMEKLKIIMVAKSSILHCDKLNSKMTINYALDSS